MNRIIHTTKSIQLTKKIGQSWKIVFKVIATSPHYGETATALMQNPATERWNTLVLQNNELRVREHAIDDGHINIAIYKKQWKAKLIAALSTRITVAEVYGGYHPRFLPAGFVNVGCQIFPFEVIEFIYKQARQAKKETTSRMFNVHCKACHQQSQMPLQLLNELAEGDFCHCGNAHTIITPI